MGTTLFIIVALTILLILLTLDFILHLLGINTQIYTRSFYYDNNILRENLTNYSFSKDFETQVQTGLEHIRKSKVVVLSLCRNVEGIIPHAITNIQNLVSSFDDYRVVLYENDSDDNTRKLLKEMISSRALNKWTLLDCCDQGACNCKLHISNPKSHGALTFERIRKMVKYRNTLLNYAKEHFPKFDYVIVYDFDMRGGIFMDGFYQTFHNWQDWDAVACRGLKPFPFTLGYLNCIHDAQAYVDWEGGQDGDMGRNHNDSNVVVKFLRQQYNVRNTTLGEKFIKVKSAFNGLCIYKLPAYISSEYSVGTHVPPCEHIGLFENMEKLGHTRVFINQSLILQSGLENESMIPLYEYMGWFM